MKLMQWAGPGDWQDSGVELPRVDARADVQLQRWCIVAGGLGLILSRLGDAECRGRYPCTQRLHEVIRDALRRSRPVNAGAHLLGDVMHEIAEVADPLTRRSLRACFDACVRAPGTPAPQGHADAAPGHRLSSLVSQPRPSQRASRLRSREDVETRLQMEVMAERDRALRQSVAARRSGTA